MTIEELKDSGAIYFEKSQKVCNSMITRSFV